MTIKTTFLFFLLVTASTWAAAQCPSFTREYCQDQISAYESDGQFSGGILFEGEEASVSQTFYDNKQYRLFVCSAAALGDSLYFEVSDMDGQLLYSSQNKGRSYWNFTVASTQDLNIRIVSPDLHPDEKHKRSGCVSILTGYRQIESQPRMAAN